MTSNNNNLKKKNNLINNKNYSISLKAFKINTYLAGLFESLGHIQISKGKASIKSFIVGITFNLKDLPICENLKN